MQIVSASLITTTLHQLHITGIPQEASGTSKEQHSVFKITSIADLLSDHIVQRVRIFPLHLPFFVMATELGHDNTWTSERCQCYYSVLGLDG